MRGLVRILRVVALVAIALTVAVVTPALGYDPENCLFCHQYRGLSYYDSSADNLRVFFVQPEYTHQRLGPHAVIPCTDCHEWSEISVVPHQPVSMVDCTKTCHLINPGGQEQRFSHLNVAEMLQKSVHPSDVLSKTKVTGGRLLGEKQSECLYCHDEPLFLDPTGSIPILKELGSRTFDRCDVCHKQQIPADIAYYVRHIAARLQPARPSLEMAQVCAVCHSDPALRGNYKMSDAVASYVRSFHGKAALLGDERTANCVSCHITAGANVHLMLKNDNPESSVSPSRVAHTCRTAACHPGADVWIGNAGVHLDLPSVRGRIEFWVALAFIILTIGTFGPSMALCVLELSSRALGGRAHHDPGTERITRAVLTHPEGRKRLTRFTVAQRVQHWVLVALFSLLALTGFPLKFADQGWSRAVIDSFGGLDTARLIHHWAGLALVAGLATHIVYIIGTMYQKRMRSRNGGKPTGLIESITSLPMWISPRDALDLIKLLAHLLRLRHERPSFGRFSIKEKFEYVGVFWGTILLGITGAMLWGEQISSHFIPGRVLNIALIAHTYEAFLAIIHVGILHIVNVMLSPNVFPLSRATITGETPIAELVEGHSDQVLETARELGINGEERMSHE